ncbi:hypothetical protein [uncultured Caulobacter sp.]|jgi:hypothetical protein|uniref:hypothetical protein n=1 Tax=uncultured Caulobacter sp. TaxID=158749 RepID=UPI0026184FED|nr:hypothetical protein [uncultured Caulobacter sp.]
MASVATWLRNASGALCALLLLAFTIVPSFDSIVCGSEQAPGVSAQVGAGDAAISQDHGAKSQHGKAGAEACAHGHCHHGASAAPAVSAKLAANAILSLTLAPGASGVPPSNPPDGPEEPPRA